jgi:hypothetical protein
MSVLTSFQGAIGGTTTLYRVLRRDYARRRRWNHTTSTWKSTVSSGDAQETLTEQATPHKGIYEVTTTGMGAPGLIHTYFKNIVSGRIVGARRVTISDGAYLNNPDAAVTTDADKLRLDLWTTVPAAGDTRYVARLEDRGEGDVWNHDAGEWQTSGSVSLADSQIPLLEDDDETNLYGAFVEDVGNRSPVRVSYYDLTTDSGMTTPLREEDITVTAGSAASEGDAPYKIEAMQAHGVLTVETRLNPTREPFLVLRADPLCSPCLMMRIVDAAGEPITPALISSIQYSLYRRSDTDLSLNTHIDGHYLKALTVNDVVLSSLQNDYLWDEADDEGYNFRHQVDTATYEALSEYNARYDLVYKFTPASGQKFPARYQVRT